MEESKKYEKVAAEYLTAFIKHLFNEGKSGFEIAELLEINSDLIEKLISDKEMLESMEKRNEVFVEQLKANHPDENEFKKKISSLRLYYQDYLKKYCDFSDRLKNIGPWQRRFHFKNGIDFYFENKKKYSENDTEVLTRLSTGTAVAEVPDNFSDRALSPDYKLRILNDLSDGQPVIYISEKYNCSEQAVKQTAEENKLTLPVSESGVRERMVKVINEGYSFEQLKKRFNIDESQIKELIAIHRLQQYAGNTVS